MSIAEDTARLRTLYESGRLPAAFDCAKRIIEQSPDDPGLLAITAGLAIEIKQFDYARQFLEPAVKSHPEALNLLYFLGLACSNLGDDAAALGHFEALLARNADHQEAMINLANAYTRLGQKEQAIQTFERIIQKWPDCEAAYKNLSVLLKSDSGGGDPIAIAKKMIELNPDDPASWMALAEAQKQKGNEDKSAEALEKALNLDPASASAAEQLATIYYSKGDKAKSIDILYAALRYNPDSHALRYALAFQLHAHGRLIEAKNTIVPALGVTKPAATRVNTLFLYAMILTDLQELDHAETVYTQIIDENAHTVSAYQNLALLQQSRGDFRRSFATSEKGLEVSGKDLNIYQNHLYFLSYHPDLDQQAIHAEYNAWAKLFKARSPSWTQNYQNSLTKERKLKIGYASPDFRGHVISYFFTQVLANHDRNKVEIHLFSNTQETDKHTEYYQRQADHWHDVRGKSAVERANIVCDAGIDVLVDLAGHTSGNMLALFALKPAPVQATWIGYANSTGLTEVDYRITDQIADPAGPDDAYYAETLTRLDNGFLSYEGPDIPLSKTLPAKDRGYITFGCFNQARKLNEEMISLWARAVAPIPKARILLKASKLGAAETQRHLLDMFEKYGLDRHRVSMVTGTSTFEQHAFYFSKVDIALDPSPYNGTTSTCEALWMGVPVLTIYGKIHAARVSASLAHQIGFFDEMVASSEEDFIAKARGLAEDLDALEAYRFYLRDWIKASSLSDFKNQTAEIEGLYQQWWNTYLENRQSA